jgi:hypothetical protein
MKAELRVYSLVNSADEWPARTRSTSAIMVNHYCREMVAETRNPIWQGHVQTRADRSGDNSC